MSIHIPKKIGRCELCNANPCTCLRKVQPTCLHNSQHYQPEEKDTNVPESLWCEDCGADLELPECEPDWDLMAKEM